jgi:hypothetical protein
LADFTAVFPKHPDADEDLPPNGCGVGGYHWVDIDQSATGIYAYTRNGRIVQFSVQTPRFSLQNGVKVGASEQQVKQLYPNGQGYVLLYSGSAVVGGRDLVFWVDKKAGVAVELYWNKKRNQRLVNGIDIFRKGADYRPEGCISPPQQWQQMK